MDCRTYEWVDRAVGVRGHRRNWVVGDGGPARRLHLDLANTKRQRVFVIIENLNLSRVAAADYCGPEAFEHRALVKGDVRPRTAARKRIRRRA